MLLVVVLIATCNMLVLMAAHDQVKNLSEVNAADYKVALVLGTSKWTVRGTQNLYFKGRVEASRELYQKGMVRHLLLSGDNSLQEYNEPLLMKKTLEEQGVPSVAMTMDFAGFRTLDSVVRSKEVFGQDSCVIVTQAFHLPRALFVARFHNLKAIGYEAPGPIPGKRIWIREILARTVAVWDIVVGTEPKFLGKKELLPVE